MFETITSHPAVSAAGFLASAFFLAAGFNQVLRLIDRLKEKPVPSETYVTKTEFQTATAAQARRHEMLEQRLDQAQQARATDRQDVLGEISSLRGEIREDLSRVHERVDDLPSQVVALLRNSGALKS